MIITNRHGLPQHIIDDIRADLERDFIEDRYSVTELLNSTKEIILKRRYQDKVVVDASEYIARMFGTAFHLMMEYDENDEIKLEYTLDNGVTISGRVDRVENGTVIDYKTSSTSKFTSGEFDDWRKQCIMYAWLFRRAKGVIISNFKIIAFLKNWSQSQVDRMANYPESAITTWETKINTADIIEIEKEIIAKVEELTKYKNSPANEMPEPKPDELWYSGDKYAVIKTGTARALRVFDTEEEAETYALAKGAQVEHRPGEFRKFEHDSVLRQVWKIE